MSLLSCPNQSMGVQQELSVYIGVSGESSPLALTETSDLVSILSSALQAGCIVYSDMLSGVRK